MNQHLRTSVLAGVFVGGTVFTAAYGQRPIPRPELLAGPWELTGASGIDGVFLSIHTDAEGTADHPAVPRQVYIRVYHRQDGHETWGWYSAAPSGPSDAPSVFDGQHLRIRSIDEGPAVDLTFQSQTHRWTGTWYRDGQPHDVVLERPRPSSDVAPSRFKGDWEGLPSDTGPRKPRTRLHVDQSSDGRLTVWMDRMLALSDQRYGELLRLVSLNEGTLTLETTYPGGLIYRFEGTLSADGSTLVGGWTNGMSGTLNAAASFRRISNPLPADPSRPPS